MDDLKNLLHQRKLKATPARLGVLEQVSQHRGAIPFSDLQRAMSKTDRITLFRTLNALLENGIIHKALFEGADTYYAMCPDTCNSKEHLHHHVHFMCKSCEEVTCVQLKESLKFSLPDHKIEDIDVNVTGTCNYCIGPN